MYRLIMFSIILFFSFPKAFADIYVQCDLCSETDRRSKANQYIRANSSPYDGVESGQQETIHVIDLAGMQASSYDWSLEDFESDLDGNWVLRSFRKVGTPSTVTTPIKKLKSDVDKLNSAAGNLVIPTSTIEDPWEFINCAYCENGVEDFLNESLEGKILTVSHTINSIAQIFGFGSAGVPNQFRVPLQNGGYLEVKMTLARGSYLIIDVTKVVDKDGNTVPFKKEGLDGLRVRISDEESARTINNYILEFEFFVPIRTGSVTITDCDIDPNDPDPENAPCG